MQNMPGRWMDQQHQAGRRLCLILEGHDDACQPLLATRDVSGYRSLYAETDLAELAGEGPVILLLEQMSEPALAALVQQPYNNWGWLGSLPGEDLAAVTRHWRDRLLVGTTGAPSMYRFHDNRTLGRALAYLQPEHLPAFLGPLVSVCYWHEERWRTADNPQPGEYPVPDPAPWLNTPNPNAEAILHANILRYLLAEHSEDLVALAEFQDPRIWLEQLLKQARTWQWRRPEQLEFLVVRRLEEATRSSVIRWQPLVGEAPGDHFERVVAQWALTRGKDE
ncbi:DUF4123 domain-containing protein [Pseudomonas lurida]|uniref:DUF4123 domain-containing protein n=1 Tax=Pseudomonas lurida TaxID=244566 RepID=A0ABY9G0P7_9PSED|nr:DUF4123 domain-containing protein [Pseudomonas lurida]MCF5025142.1 DUF4123 domain-containing protein [Pseudomonas lurida]MCF5308319.1 DUF4123 domain-containing protein [Pseudomonas lurida]MCF5327075.1 DUF4123 domain-containing protein [Pseudomonas lurida]WLH09191.1 DUF4123 domain-containing protein [Pseudomonas lurida]